MTVLYLIGASLLVTVPTLLLKSNGRTPTEFWFSDAGKALIALLIAFTLLAAYLNH